jgi:regulator of protease activity HflC (stomatin/prohibitin superfamily)
MTEPSQTKDGVLRRWLGRIKGLAMLVSIVAIIGAAVGYTFGYVVRPGWMGVRKITLRLPVGPRQGYSDEALPPGYHWAIPYYSTVHSIPQTLQIMNLDRDKTLYPGSPGALEVQTTDGSSVEVDASILYRFYPARGADHGGPAELLNVVGFSEADWRAQIQTVVMNELRKVLGKLSASEFYDPKRREDVLAKAKAEMNHRLRPDGILVEAVLLRRYTYAVTIDEAIFQKNLKDQEPRLRQAEGSLADAKAQVEQVRAQGDAKIKTLLVQGDNDARVLQSKGDLYEATKRGEGDLAVAKAKAEVDRIRAGALASSAGADIYVARQLAPLLSSLKGGVVTQVDPYNFEAWIKRLGLPERQP